MEFRTIVDIPASSWKIEPCERMLFVGSCFADNIGKRFQEEKFRAVVNPYGVMYNPASILHTVKRLMDDGAMPFKEDEAGTAVFTLGTNHVYILKETGEIVDNCRKRPQILFQEKELSVEECAGYLQQAIDTIHERYPLVRFILTVSPIRYRKYGYHGSQLSKATLLLAVARLEERGKSREEREMSVEERGKSREEREMAQDNQERDLSTLSSILSTLKKYSLNYFPSYEIMNDELRDYRFYKPDMLHPSDQAVEYIYERMAETYFSESTVKFLKEWKPIKEALSHRPFHPESEEYKKFKAQTEEKLRALKEKYPEMEL